MKKKITKKDETYKEWVSRQHERLRSLLFLNEWSYTILYANKNSGCDHSGFLRGECKTDLKYLSYHITLYPVVEEYWNEGKYEICLRTILHELCHVHTEPMYERAIFHCPPAENNSIETMRENATERMSNIIAAMLSPEKTKAIKKDVKLHKTRRR